MPSFSLRPVNDPDPSPSPTASGSPDSQGPAPPPPPRSRRPLSPSSLRDVDLTHTPDMPPRRYPAPPTGHDLMAMFPPAAPDNFSEMRPGPTSGYFQRQERAFFAQAGREIVRVRVDVDLPPSAATAQSDKRPWPPASPAPGPTLYAPPRPPTHARAPSGGVPATPVFPPAPHPHAHPHPHHPPHASPHPTPNMHHRSPPPDTNGTGNSNGGGDEFRTDDPDEAWRRPMPYNERRRAGKHTRRVVVRT